jgi:hypothetical protein
MFGEFSGLRVGWEEWCDCRRAQRKNPRVAEARPGVAGWFVVVEKQIPFGNDKQGEEAAAAGSEGAVRLA